MALLRSCWRATGMVYATALRLVAVAVSELLHQPQPTWPARQGQTQTQSEKVEARLRLQLGHVGLVWLGLVGLGLVLVWLSLVWCGVVWVASDDPLSLLLLSPRDCYPMMAWWPAHLC